MQFLSTRADCLYTNVVFYALLWVIFFIWKSQLNVAGYNTTLRIQRMFRMEILNKSSGTVRATLKNLIAVSEKNLVIQENLDIYTFERNHPN